MSQYWWEGAIAEKVYWNIEAFTIVQNNSRIISSIEEIAIDECPIIAFFDLDGNQKFLDWITESVVIANAET